MSLQSKMGDNKASLELKHLNKLISLLQVVFKDSENVVDLVLSEPEKFLEDFEQAHPKEIKLPPGTPRIPVKKEIDPFYFSDFDEEDEE